MKNRKQLNKTQIINNQIFKPVIFRNLAEMNCIV